MEERYRNYAVLVRLDRQAELQGRVTDGLTYEEIGAVVEAMDARFAAALELLPTLAAP